MAICGVQFTFCIVGTVLVNYFSRQVRFISCFSLLLLLFCICSLFALLDTSHFNEEFFGTSLAIAVLMTILSSTLNISCSVEASEFHLLSPFLSGQSVAGILAAIANIVSIFFSPNVYWEAFSFFMSAALVMCISWFAYGFIFGCCDYSISEYDLIDANSNETTEENRPLLLPEGAKPTPMSYTEIMKEIWFELASLTITFCITIAVFPTLVSMYRPTDTLDWLPEKYFLPIFCFLNFNLFDFIGREIAGRWRMIVNRQVLGVLVFLRLAVLVLLPMTNCQPRSTPVYLQSDYAYILLIFVLGLTNGLCATISFRHGTSLVSYASSSRASALLTTFLTLGLTLGAFGSFLVVLGLSW